MPQFKRKPETRIFEVEQFNDGSPEVANGVCFCPCPQADRGDYVQAHVHTIHEGQVCLLESGDWVMPEPEEGKFYPIKDEIFAATYEPVEKTGAA